MLLQIAVYEVSSHHTKHNIFAGGERKEQEGLSATTFVYKINTPSACFPVEEKQPISRPAE